MAEKTERNPKGSGRPIGDETTTINFRVKKSLAQSIKDKLRPIVKKLNKM